MTENQKKDIIMFTAILENLDDIIERKVVVNREMVKVKEDRFKDWSNKNNPLFLAALEKTRDGIKDLIDCFRDGLGGGLDQKELSKLTKQVTTGEYFYAVFQDEEYKQWSKRNLKTDIKISKEPFFNICEQLMHIKCNKCTRKKKSCGLRTDFLKAKVPKFEDTNKGLCEYWYDSDKNNGEE